MFIADASRTLGKTERNFGQIAREGLPVGYCVTRFDQYLTGRGFIMITDHEPLLELFNPEKKGALDNLPHIAPVDFVARSV